MDLIDPPFEYDGIQEKFVKEKIRCFEERFKGFLSEMETDVTKQLRGFQRTRERMIARLEVIEGVETVLKKEKEKIKEALIALVGFDINGKEEIVTTTTSNDKGVSLCTDESIISSL